MRHHAYNLLLCGLLISKPGSTTDQLCPNDMVLVGRNLCIDRFEYPNKIGQKPLIAVSGIPEDGKPGYDAEGLCASVGKRVATIKEWINACEGPEHFKYSYGNTYNPEACNTEKLWRSVDMKKVARRDPNHLNWLDQSEPNGIKDSCVSPVGAYNMIGNVEEWVKCDSGEYGWCLVGGFWASGKHATCRYSITKHAPNWHYYNGFRCVKDIKN